MVVSSRETKRQENESEGQYSLEGGFKGGIKGAVTVLLLKHLILLLKQAVISKAIKVNPGRGG